MESGASWGNLGVSVYNGETDLIVELHSDVFHWLCEISILTHLYFLALVRVLDVVLGINYQLG